MIFHLKRREFYVLVQTEHLVPSPFPEEEGQHAWKDARSQAFFTLN